jgi:hypothetical protein
MSRCARDFTKFVFSSSMSDVHSKKENIFVPKLLFKCSRTRGWFSLNFPAGIRGYFHSINYPIRLVYTGTWGECKATTYLKKRSVETSEKLRCRLHSRYHPLQRCAGLSPISFEPSGSSIFLGIMSSRNKLAPQ